MAVDHLGDQLEDLIDPVALASPLANAASQSATVPLAASSLKRARCTLRVTLASDGDVLGDLRARQLDPVELDVVTRLQLESDDELERRERRHLGQEPRDRGLDQLPGVRGGGQAGSLLDCARRSAPISYGVVRLDSETPPS